jgi:hypothetical protein
MTWKASGDSDLPLADREREWDGDEASQRVFDRAGWDDDPKPGQAREAFFAYDDSEPENKTAYKLPFADVINGRLQAVPRAIFAVAQVLEGARGGVDLPQEVQASVRRKVETYYRKMGEEAPWKSD